MRSHEEGRGYNRRVFFTVRCPKRKVTLVPMRTLGDLSRWMPV